MSTANRMRDWLTGRPSQSACEACLVRVWSRNQTEEWVAMSERDVELGQTEYRSMSVTPIDPGILNAHYFAEVNLPEYHVNMRINVTRWPNDWDSFMNVQRLAVQVMHEFNRCFRGYADAQRHPSEDDVPF